MEKILDKKEAEDGTWLYRVKWRGYSYEENTWEPRALIPEYILKVTYLF